ncbi:hypothetical protein ETAA8_30120 [Anatilimnocola aggregata]|uniref:Uncharacterized protein n=1 Tax=Anatilimnocola aggregata TaxID=2528021 RepID=A0A517YCH4_9BACT|nr:hypothetical protein [Anatilimnocola aggregata]QDU27921.1 hypothetical protein ETAA8_30120 [Anatilimnocola aggregata]
MASWFPPPVTSLWPGLARLWLRGEIRGLLTAVAFTLAVNFALITTLVWPQLVSRQLPPWLVPTTAWIVVVWFWVAGMRAGGQLAAAIARANRPADKQSFELYRQAQLEYLKGHLLEAESRLLTLLNRTPGDVEARLLLASVQRRTKRPAEARQSLAQLAELSGSALWSEEVQRELVQVKELERELQLSTGIVKPKAA